MTFIIWGAIHGLVLMVEKGTFKIKQPKVKKRTVYKVNKNSNI